MILTVPRGTNQILSENLNALEVDCKCHFDDCKQTYIDELLIESFQELRDKCGPLKVLSGFRCVKWNQHIGGKEKSFHCLGMALDLSSPNLTRYALARSAKRVLGFSNGGIGLYDWGIHCDVRGTPARW